MEDSIVSAIDVVILGLIKREPISAYDLVSYIKQNDVDQFVRISKPAIYRNVRHLQRKGYVEGSLSKTKLRPEKRTFQITPSGVVHLQELIGDVMSEGIQYEMNINAALMFADELPGDEGTDRVEQLRSDLENKRSRLRQQYEQPGQVGFAGKEIVRQQMKMNDAMLDWLNRFGQILRKTSADR